MTNTTQVKQIVKEQYQNIPLESSLLEGIK